MLCCASLSPLRLGSPLFRRPAPTRPRPAAGVLCTRDRPGQSFCCGACVVGFLVVDVELAPEPVQVDEEDEHGERQRDQQRVVPPRFRHERGAGDEGLGGLNGARVRGVLGKSGWFSLRKLPLALSTTQDDTNTGCEQRGCRCPRSTVWWKWFCVGWCALLPGVNNNFSIMIS